MGEVSAHCALLSWDVDEVRRALIFSWLLTYFQHCIGTTHSTASGGGGQLVQSSVSKILVITSNTKTQLGDENRCGIYSTHPYPHAGSSHSFSLQRVSISFQVGELQDSLPLFSSSLCVFGKLFQHLFCGEKSGIASKLMSRRLGIYNAAAAAAVARRIRCVSGIIGKLVVYSSILYVSSLQCEFVRFIVSLRDVIYLGTYSSKLNMSI